MSKTLIKIIGTLSILFLVGTAIAFGQATANPGIPLTGGDVKVYHKNGGGFFVNATTSSDVGRGIALRTALSACTNGDTYILATSTYTIGNNTIDGSCGGGGISIHGAGKYLTNIKSSDSGDVILKLGNGEYTDMSIIGTAAQSIPMGFSISGGDFVPSKAIVRNVYTQGAFDGLVTLGGTKVSQVDVSNWTCSSNFDCLNWSDIGGQLRVYDSDFSLTYNGASSLMRCMTEDSSTIYIYNTTCSMTDATGGHTTYGVDAQGGTLHIAGGTWSTPSNETTSYNFRQVGGTIGLTSNTIYTIASTTGTLTYDDQASIFKALANGYGTSGQVLQSNGSGQASWVAAASGCNPSGSSGYVQYNNGAGGCGASANLFWNAANNRLGVGSSTPSTTFSVDTGTSSLTLLNVYRNVNTVMAFDGDSLTYGYNCGVAPCSWPFYFTGVSTTTGLNGSGYLFGNGKWGTMFYQNNSVIGGEIQTTVSPGYPTGAGGSIAPHGPNQSGYYFLDACINDINNAHETGASCWAQLQTMYARARADGYKVVAFTVAPILGAKDNVTPLVAGSESHQPERLKLNDLMRADHGVSYDYLVDVAAAMPDSTDTRYFVAADQIHWTGGATGGNHLVAALVRDTLDGRSFVRRAHDTTASSTNAGFDTIFTGNYLGIGTSSPNEKLSVYGNIETNTTPGGGIHMMQQNQANPDAYIQHTFGNLFTCENTYVNNGGTFNYASTTAIGSQNGTCIQQESGTGRLFFMQFPSGSGGGAATPSYGAHFTKDGYLIIQGSNVAGGSIAEPTYPLTVTGQGQFSNLVDADHFVATSTTATSTFAGAVSASADNLNKGVVIETLMPNPKFLLGTFQSFSTTSGITNLKVNGVEYSVPAGRRALFATPSIFNASTSAITIQAEFRQNGTYIPMQSATAVGSGGVSNSIVNSGFIAEAGDAMAYNVTTTGIKWTAGSKAGIMMSVPIIEYDNSGALMMASTTGGLNVGYKTLYTVPANKQATIMGGNGAFPVANFQSPNNSAGVFSCVSDAGGTSNVSLSIVPNGQTVDQTWQTTATTSFTAGVRNNVVTNFTSSGAGDTIQLQSDRANTGQFCWTDILEYKTNGLI